MGSAGDVHPFIALGAARLSASHPQWFKQGLFRLVDTGR
jgi:hypothetical protein